MKSRRSLCGWVSPANAASCPPLSIQILPALPSTGHRWKGRHFNTRKRISLHPDNVTDYYSLKRCISLSPIPTNAFHPKGLRLGSHPQLWPSAHAILVCSAYRSPLIPMGWPMYGEHGEVHDPFPKMWHAVWCTHMPGCSITNIWHCQRAVHFFVRQKSAQFCVFP